MTRTLVLTQHALRARDVQRIVQLHAGSDEAGPGTRYLVLVPVGSESAVIEAINHLSLGDLREAWQSISGSDEHSDRARAAAALRESMELFAQTGAATSGALTPADPMDHVHRVVAAGEVSQLIVVTEPQAVQDILNQDWASRAERTLDLPVLHFYSGTDHVG